VCIVHLLPEGETVLLAEGLQLGIAENGELLVGGAVNQETDISFLQCGLDAHSLVNGVLGNLPIEIVGKECGKLYTEQDPTIFDQMLEKGKGDAKLSGFELSLALFF
jgi:hypothetical protein